MKQQQLWSDITTAAAYHQYHDSNSSSCELEQAVQLMQQVLHIRHTSQGNHRDCQLCSSNISVAVAVSKNQVKAVWGCGSGYLASGVLGSSAAPNDSFGTWLGFLLTSQQHRSINAVCRA
eukprot:GHUV01001772.1.p4 GENE.GHUV01001772.1~~GHUV01001772.1.p4  ORF type:complete len:120 (+),score=30.19 GHUV01001772.1:1024-1383(+)